MTFPLAVGGAGVSICGLLTVPTLTCPVKIIYVFGLVRLVSVTAWGGGRKRQPAGWLR